VSLWLSAAPLWIEADPTRLKQIIENLLINAVRYTPAGGRIAVRADAVDGEAVLLVRDAGIGIVAEMLSRVFELFVRTDGARAHAPDGMGIGLTLVRQLVALHGGRVVAHSEGPGQGAEFTVRLPLSVASEPSGCTAPALAD
jgi:signal transduction histidine kinase